jgi:predicted metal-dependent HD superfamily phosphohydrolase
MDNGVRAVRTVVAGASDAAARDTGRLKGGIAKHAEQDRNMNDDFNIAPTEVLIRYLCLFRRWLLAAQRYVQNHDEHGVFLSAWIADALHNIPTMLWRYDPSTNWNSPQELADWIKVFPQVVRKQGAPARIASECDAIFSPEGAVEELHLRDDLSDLDLARPRMMSAYLDLLYSACVGIRTRPGGENPWTQKSEFWQEREAETTAAMGRIADVLVEVPCALVHWSTFDEARFTAQATALWEDWPRDFGLERYTYQGRVQRLQSRWIEPVSFLKPHHRATRVFFWLARQYRQFWREYHDLAHIERMFVTWDALGDAIQVSEPLTLTLAIWFHDAVYDPKQSDNEAQSADVMVQQLKPYNLSKQKLTRIQHMIMATKTHQTEKEDGDTALFLDLDLAILGAEESEYDAYARAIREEYRFVSEEDYRKGRTQVLRQFLERPRIYLTEPMFARYEQKARQNLAREITALEGGHQDPEAIARKRALFSP